MVTVEVSVIIPIKDENDLYIDRCLESLKKQRYHGTFEILVVKGGNRAQARNFGINQAKGEIIAFIDSDCVASENWLSLLVHELNKDKTLGGVGGVNLSPANGPSLGKAIDFVFSSYLGSLGSASLHVPKQPKFITALACINSAFWKNILKKINGFDEEFALCEDTNLSYKIRESGHKLLFNPQVLVWHYRRDTIKRFAKQFFLYGLGRMRSIMTNKNYASKSAVIPFFGVLIFVAFAWAFPLPALACLVVYLSAIFIKGFEGSLKAKKASFLLMIPGLFIIEHLSYFVGMVAGIFQGKWTINNGACEIFHYEIVANTN